MSGLVIRPAALSDAEEMLAVYAPYVRETAVSFEYAAPSAEEFRGRIRAVTEQFPWLAAERDGELVGYAYASRFHGRAAYRYCCETSVYIRADKKRLGAGKALYQALEAALKRQGIRNLYACIAVSGTADEYLTPDSVRFHEALGFAPAGRFHRCGYKFNRWYDVVWMEKIIAPASDSLSDDKTGRSKCPPQ